MKKISIYRNSIFLIIVTLFFATCTKETADVRLAPTLTTSQYQNLTSDSVTIVGYIVAAGGGFTTRGICFSTDTLPTVSNNTVVYSGSGKQAAFNVQIKVSRLTKFHARAYGTASNGDTYYGTDIVFTTPAALPKLASIIVPSLRIAQQDSGITAQTNVNITDDGYLDNSNHISARGVVYGLTSNLSPDSTNAKIANNKTFVTKEGTGKGTFASFAMNLKGNTPYYLRAYATNAIGNGYSNTVSFTTPKAYAIFLTEPVTAITKTSATLNGIFTSNGGGTLTERGFVYSTSANPTTTSGTKVTVSNTGNDTIHAGITALTVNTTYHVRAYAINEVGTNYGADITFKTLANITKFWLVGDYNGWSNTTSANYIISTATSTTAEGYVYLTAGGIKLVTDQSWDNAHTFGDDGSNSGKLTNPGNNITVPATGYYLIRADQGAMTYSLTATTWGIIGDATPGGWGTQTNMTYYPSTGVFGIDIDLTSGGSFKFRGTSDWAINYGSTAGDGVTLDAGGSNVPVVTTGNYSVTLNLSVPNNYTYLLATWSIIGDATSGGWSTDTPLTWDATNKVFKVTTTLSASGTFKFRANNSWNAPNPNYGGSLGALTQGGANIPVPANGSYTITFNPWTLVGTLTAN
ncbi:MAG TPA: SusF/SusE family outer membrane protein [Bacteroidales bacterium]